MQATKDQIKKQTIEAIEREMKIALKHRNQCVKWGMTESADMYRDDYLALQKQLEFAKNA